LKIETDSAESGIDGYLLPLRGMTQPPLSMAERKIDFGVQPVNSKNVSNEGRSGLK
jgi:hypothetical protein